MSEMLKMFLLFLGFFIFAYFVADSQEDKSHAIGCIVFVLLCGLAGYIFGRKYNK
jgi:Ca2+/Na+ antiporter